MPAASLSGLVLLAGLEGNLQHAVTQAVAVKASDSHGGFVVVGHGDKAKALTFIGGEVTDDLDVGDGAEGPKELPQDAFVRLGGQVVYKDAPAGSSWTSKVDSGQASHAVNGDGRESGEESGRTTMGVILKFNTASSSLYCLLWACFSVRNGNNCSRVWSRGTPSPSLLLYSKWINMCGHHSGSKLPAFIENDTVCPETQTPTHCAYFLC